MLCRLVNPVGGTAHHFRAGGSCRPGRRAGGSAAEYGRRRVVVDPTGRRVRRAGRLTAGEPRIRHEVPVGWTAGRAGERRHRARHDPAAGGGDRRPVVATGSPAGHVGAGRFGGGWLAAGHPLVGADVPGCRAERGDGRRRCERSDRCRRCRRHGDRFVYPVPHRPLQRSGTEQASVPAAGRVRGVAGDPRRRLRDSCRPGPVIGHRVLRGQFGDEPDGAVARSRQSRLSRPSASVSLMPYAHLLIVLNVAGATTIASGGGSTSGSSGRLYSDRTA